MDVSHTDFIHQRKKPSLVVMGLRKTILNNPRRVDGAANSCLGLLRFALSIISPFNIGRNVSLGIHWMWKVAVSIFGGVGVFVKSLLYPPHSNGN